MRVAGSLVLAAFFGETSARAIHGLSKPSLEPKAAPQLAQDERPRKLAESVQKQQKQQSDPSDALAGMNAHEAREYIWVHLKWDGDEFPLTAQGYPYKHQSLEVKTAEEEGRGNRAGGRYQEEMHKLRAPAAAREAEVQARVKDLHAKHEAHQEQAKAKREEVKEVARKKHLSKVMQVPLDAPVDEGKDESAEQAQAPWPQTPETLEAAGSSPPAADNALSAAESRPAAQGEAQEEKPKKVVHDWKAEKLNAFYKKKCNMIFSGLDSDDDDMVEEEEVFAFFDAAWHGYDATQLMNKFLNEADEDKDGQVSRSEFHIFAEQAQTISKSKAERWNPLEHLKTGVSANLKADMENNIAELNGYYRRVVTRVFRRMDTEKDEIATRAEIEEFLDRKFHEQDPVEFGQKLIDEADKDGDGKVTLTEFLNFAADATKTAKNNQQKWNPLLHIADTVKRNKALDTVHIR